MAEIRLPKLPERTPAKITITVMPDLGRSLAVYATLYRETYGEKVDVAELIPFILEAYLAGDKALARALKSGEADGRAAP